MSQLTIPQIEEMFKTCSEEFMYSPVGLSALVGDPYVMLDKAIDYYKPSIALVMLSGGNDSTATAACVMDHPWVRENSFVLHVNTGTGIPETNQFVHETCAEQGWTLKEYKAAEHIDAKGNPAPILYKDMVLQMGFPGPKQHNVYYGQLKGKPLAQALRELKMPAKKILLISGVRQDESIRRMGIHTPWGRAKRRNGTQYGAPWVNPLFFFNKTQCRDVIKSKNITPNPVCGMICMSGECLCGAFAKPGESHVIEAAFPEHFQKFRKLESEVFSKFPWKWDQVPPASFFQEKRGQQRIPGLETQLLCASCADKQLGVDSVIETPIKWRVWHLQEQKHPDYKEINCLTNKEELAVKQFEMQYPNLQALWAEKVG